MRHGLFAALVLAAGFTVSTAAAQQPAAPSEVDQVVVTANRLALPAVSGTVLTKADLSPGDSLADALSQVPDIEVNRPGGRGGVASIYLRGADPNYTVVLFEGVPLNDPTNTRGGSYNASEFGTIDAARIEIVPGAMSAIYGSGAMAGVVDVFAPTPTATGGWTADASGGILGDYGAALGWRGPLAGRLGAFVSTSYEDEGHPVDGSHFAGRAFTAKLAPVGAAQDDPGGIVLRIDSQDARDYPDDSGGPLYAVSKAVEQRRSLDVLLGARDRFSVAQSVVLELAASVTERREKDDTPSIAPGVLEPTGEPAQLASNNFTRARVQALIRTQPVDHLSLLGGVEEQEERGSSVGSLDYGGFLLPTDFRISRSTPAVFAETGFDKASLALDASVRLDHPQGFGSRGSWRLGGSWSLAQGVLVLHTAASAGFKAPSFYALANPLVGNPSLVPETSLGEETGIRWRAPFNAVVDLTGFHTAYDNLVDFVAGPPPRLENISHVLTQGASGDASIPLGVNADLQLSAAYIDARNQMSGERLLQRPNWRGAATVAWQLSPALTARLTGRWIGTRLDASIPTGMVVLPAYATVDVELRRSFGPGLLLDADILNMLDRRYQEAVGFPAPGVELRLALRKAL